MFSVLPCMQTSFFVNYKQYLTDNQGGNTLQKTHVIAPMKEPVNLNHFLSVENMLEEG